MRSGTPIIGTGWWLLAAGVVAAGLVPSAQQPAMPTFRTGVEVVVLDVSVVDKDHAPVRGLTATDFTILEDGTPQQVVTFSAIDVPAIAAPQPALWLRDVPPDVVTNTAVPTSGRLIVFVLDDVTPMAPGEAGRAIDLANAAIDRLGPSDVAAVVFTGGRAAGQNFTSDCARLRSAVARFVPRMDRDFDLPDQSREAQYSAVLATLRSLVDRLATLGQRRKAVLWVSAGIPLGAGIGPFPDVLWDEWFQMCTLASRANITIYALDPGGRRGEAIDLHVGPTENRSPFQPATREEGKANRHFLEAVSASTGGFAVTGSNDPGPGLARLFAESGSYYLLGYQSSNRSPKKKQHTLDVRVNRPGVTVQSRTMVSPASAQPRTASAPGRSLLTGALRALLPIPDVSLRATAAPFLVAGRSRPTLVVVLTVDQTTPLGDTAAIDNVDVVVSAYDVRGRPAGSVTTHVKVGVAAGSDNVQYEVLTPIEIDPGRYAVQVAAATTLVPKAGSVTCEVDVPDFARTRLSLSGVVLIAEPALAATPRDGLRSVLPVVPTSRRDFTRDQKVLALVRAYQGGTGTMRPVALSMAIIDSNGAVVFQAHETLGPDRFAKDRAAEYRLDLPLARLGAGPHLLTIDATFGKETAHRAVRFDVR
jgi:VWFA-related protein